uniref:Uncharacterized protein n=1 Tax=Amphimedon queenslandica TaxID=400682 RepID=A0A1X7T4M1_AMPQE
MRASGPAIASELVLLVVIGREEWLETAVVDEEEPVAEPTLPASVTVDELVPGDDPAPVPLLVVP